LLISQSPVASTGMVEPIPMDRIARLEAFRGLGALAVLVTHCFLAVPWDGTGAQLAIIKLVCAVYNGHAALMIFFVISGYVLGLSLDKGAVHPDNFFRFYVRRLFRIYPAHVVATAFIAVVLSSFDHAVPLPQASKIFDLVFAAPRSPVGGLFNSLLLRVDMNGVTWTLALEMAVSILFPVLYLTSRHRSWWVRAAMLVTLIAISEAVGDRINQVGAAFIADQPPGTLRAVLFQFSYVPALLTNVALYGFVFYIGLVAEPVFKQVVPRIERRWGSWLMWFALFLAVTAQAYTGGLTATSILIETCGATFLVFGGALMRTHNGWTRTLDSAFFRRLGTISYSFYLYHFIVLFCIGTVMFRVLDPTLVRAYPLPFVSALAGLAFVVTAAIAGWSYRLIEVPPISYSKRASVRGTILVFGVPVSVAVVVLLVLRWGPSDPIAATQEVPSKSPSQQLAVEALGHRTDSLLRAPRVAQGRSRKPAPRPFRAVSLPFHLGFGDSAARPWMASGWYDPEAAGGGIFAWSAGDRSVVTVPLPSGGDIRLDFEALPFVFPRSPQQVVTIALNGSVVEEVRLGPGKQRYSVVLPSRALHTSLDTLDFHYAYVRSPHEVLRSFLGLVRTSRDSRTLAVAWYSLDFSKPTPNAR
jgi:peptidoglycan/LPS O-acetylase OafA/YrhL